MSFNISTGFMIALLGNTAPFGSVASLLANGTIDIFAGVRPAGGADDTEGVTPLLSITLDGGAFAAGSATNGINLGVVIGTTLKRAIDPVTLVTEVWKGLGIADGTAGWARWYANDKLTGASTTAIRMDGVIATSGGDINMINGTAIVTGIASEVTDVAVTMVGI